ALVVVLQEGPDRGPAGRRHGADGDDAALFLVVHADAVVHDSQLPAVHEHRGRAGVVLGPDDHGGGRVRRPGGEVELVLSTVDSGEVVGGAVPVERTRLAVVAGEQHGVRPLVGREAVEGGG